MHRTNSYFKKLEKPGETEPMVELAAPGVASNGRRINAATYATPTPPSHEAGRRPKPPLPNAATDFLAAVFEQGDDGRVVMDPMAVLRQCIRYFSSHPEVYGTDMRAILDREVMHVMRLKASEVALIGSESVQCTTDCGIVPVSHAAPSTMLPPLLSATKYAHGANLRNNGSSGDTPTGGGAFGYGGISFVQPTAGLLALLKTTTGTTVGPSAAVSEPIAWEGLLPRTDLEEARLGSADSNRAERNTAFMSGGTFLQSFPPTTQKSVVVDGVGYEVAFLRGELQQLEAAYNAKCVRLHELVDENSHLLSQLKVSNERAEKYLASWTALQAQLEVMKRELDGWKERAHDAQNMMTNQRNKHNSQSRRNNSTQLSDAKAEVTKLTELWRGTERALQESRRAFENSEKEANMSHDHLSDSFRYIERLERRVHRRNQFIHLANRRQRSLEEKYEKLMWCFRELGTMSGAHSYVDHLLAENPIWTLFLFVHLQRQAGSFLPVSIPTEPNCPDTTAPRNSLTFFRSINGGTFVDECYDPTTVYDVMASEATALNERRRKVKQVRTNLHGTVACRTLRWLNAYSLDFLGGEDTNPDSSPVNRRKLPILTLASLIVPLRKPDGTRVVPLPPLPEPTEDGEPAPAVDDSLHDLVPNTKAYSQSTIRFVLRSFWKERLSEYEREMDRHAHEAVEHAARRESRATSGSSTIKGVEVEAVDARSSDDDEVPVRNTFLAALIIFAIRFLHPNLAEAELTEAELAAVRGVPSRSERNMWDGGRLFFATVMHAKSRRPAAFASDEAPPPPPDISPGVAELLCALYYYTMEYRDHDADFRLFYLVSHQLIPEMVGINFYASIEAFQADGVAALRRWLHTPIPDGQHLGDAEAPHKDGEEDDFMPFADPNDPKASSRDFRTDQPLGALARVATLVDQTPLIGELEEAEEDSDGEGFGTILPGRNHTASPPKASPDITNTERSSSAISVHSNSERRSERSTTPSPDRLLVHGLREYLDELRHRRDGEEFTADPSPLEGPQYKEDDVFPAWELVDHRIHAILGPHSSILADYDEARSTGIYGKLRFDRTRAQRATMDNVKRRTTAAMRGLLPLHEVLRLFHRHCFTTYAVTCCGVPRFSLASALFPPTSTSLHDYLPPLQPVGQVPPSGLHLQRLRFALALDQPSSLIHFSRIFDYDPHTTSPSHFYQEYLTLTLDVFLQQQKFMMDAVLRSCAARHERYAAEGAEDCDGNLPVASLKKGMLNTFDRLGLDASQAISFMHHLMQYDKLLLHEDEVKLEQFTDAPFYINTGPDSSRAASANGPIPPTTNNDDFNLMEESQSCSLLHLSLAVRMLYIVWGPNATEAARTLISNSATLPITDSTQEEHRPSSRVVGAKAPVYASEKQLARAATAAFEEEVKGAYLSCAHRLERGNAGMENPLRRVTAPVEDDRRNSASLSNSVSQLQMPSTPTQSGGGSPSKHRTTFTLGAYPTCQNLLTPNVKPATAAEAAAAANETAKTRAKKKKSLVDPLHAQRLQMLIQGRASNLQASLDASTFVLARLLGLQASQCGSLKAKAKKVKKVAKKEEKESPSAGLHGLSAFGATVMLERLRTKVDLLVCEQEDELAEKLVIPGTPVVAAKKAGKTRTRQGSQKKVVFEEGKRPELPRRLSNLGRWAPSFEDPTPSVATDQTPTRSSKEASKKTAKIPINVSRLRSSCAALSLL